MDKTGIALSALSRKGKGEHWAERSSEPTVKICERGCHGASSPRERYESRTSGPKILSAAHLF